MMNASFFIQIYLQIEKDPGENLDLRKLVFLGLTIVKLKMKNYL